ncbi:hypothetical protein BKA80DRAFT_263370 [Phyllosticta citrichinensis]
MRIGEQSVAETSNCFSFCWWICAIFCGHICCLISLVSSLPLVAETSPSSLCVFAILLRVLAQ